MRLNDLRAYPGTRDYLEANWFSPGDILLAHSDDPNREAFSAEIKANFEAGLSADPHDIPAFSGRKYDDYGGYGACVKPQAIFEVGVAAGYSTAGMIWGALQEGCVVEYVYLMDFHPDLLKAAKHLEDTFPGTAFENCLADTQTEAWRDADPKTFFDIVHIDACHTFEGCLNDLRHFGPWCRRNGLIVVDDAKDPNIAQACWVYQRESGLVSRFIDNHNGHILMTRES